MKLGERLRELRHQQGMTLVKLAEICPLSLTYLSEIERGMKRPSLEALGHIARALETTIPNIFFDVDEYGPLTAQALPPGLPEMITAYGPVPPEWLNLLCKIEIEGRRPQTATDWAEIYLHLKSKLGETL